jgi:hypothetical protein
MPPAAAAHYGEHGGVVRGRAVLFTATTGHDGEWEPHETHNNWIRESGEERHGIREGVVLLTISLWRDDVGVDVDVDVDVEVHVRIHVDDHHNVRR